MISHSDPERWTRDPRPDLATDSALWARLLALAYAGDGGDPYGLFGALHGLRCMGASLRIVRGTTRVMPGEMTQEEYSADRQTYLLRHRAALVDLLRQLDVVEEKAA